MKRLPIIISFVFFILSTTTNAQTDILAEGEKLFAAGQFQQAEQLFRTGLTAEPENVNYLSQLGVCLIQQKKYKEADAVLAKVLAKDKANFSALWYSGVSKYSTKQYSDAVSFFEKVLPLLPKDSPQYPSAYWFIGKSLSGMLKTEGITEAQAGRMFESFEQYLQLQPNAHDAAKISAFVTAAKANKPKTITDKWVAQ